MTVLLIAVGVLTIHTVVNVTFFFHRPPSIGDSKASVAILLPVRDEAHRVTPCLDSLLAQDGQPTVIVLDDGSTDGTADIIKGRADGRATVLSGAPLPEGWLGKPHACQQLADAAGDVEFLAFVDADVVLTRDAVRRAVALAQESHVDLLSPYPRITANTVGERLVQPLLQWSWLTFLPLWAMERLRNPALAAAGSRWPTAPGWRPAACTRPGASSSRATASRCGRRSGRR